MTTESIEVESAPGNGPGRTFAVVLNLSAGALVGTSDAGEAVRAAFAENGLTPIFIATQAGDLPVRMALARDSGAEAVVVVGGDGTVACAAQSLAGSSVPLGILPSGTINLLAKDLAISIGDGGGGPGSGRRRAARHRRGRGERPCLPVCFGSDL